MMAIKDLLPETEYRPKYPDSPFIHVADLVDKKTGRTYREQNADLKHIIPIGALVEILPTEEDDNDSAGVRLFVVSHERDCDMTPLYSLAIDPNDTVKDRHGFGNLKWHNGYPEYLLKVIKNPRSVFKNRPRYTSEPDKMMCKHGTPGVDCDCFG